MPLNIQLSPEDLPALPGNVARVHRAAAGARQEPPRQLYRPASAPESFPVDAMGPTLEPVTRAIIELTQAPDGICANSVLGAASLAAQAHADIQLPGLGRPHPITLFLLTIAPSGERKTTADREALIGVRNRERELREGYKEEFNHHRNATDVYEAARSEALKKTKTDLATPSLAPDALGTPPAAPLKPIILVTEPTTEGTVKLLAESQPTVGIFSSEGGSFLGGHSLSEEAKLRSAARLSSLWDGEPIDRIRSGDGSSVIVGKRLAIHLMAQPEAAAPFLADPLLRGQGLLSRFLISAPAPTAGTRLFRSAKAESLQTVGQFAELVGHLLRTIPSRGVESDLPVLVLEPDAMAVFVRFHDAVEREIGGNRKLSPIRGFASKLAEHAARVAGVLAILEDPDTRVVNRRSIECGINLANFYAGECLRLTEEARVADQLRIADRLRTWLYERGRPMVYLAEIYQRGPSELRSKADAIGAARILEDHGYLLRLQRGVEIDGCKRDDAWELWREEE